MIIIMETSEQSSAVTAVGETRIATEMGQDTVLQTPENTIVSTPTEAPKSTPSTLVIPELKTDMGAAQVIDPNEIRRQAEEAGQPLPDSFDKKDPTQEGKGETPPNNGFLQKILGRK